MILDTKPKLPLIRHFQPGATLAWVDQPINPELFIALANKLADGLPESANIVNLCEDRYHFLLAFSVALIAGKLTLTPASRAPHAVAQIQRDFGLSHVIDDAWLAKQLPLIDAEARSIAAAGITIPEIDADQPAIILFTSGSSGQATAHSKTWGMLVQGADQLQRAFDVQIGSSIIGTVPPQHMFGLESTIVFPLQWGCAIHHERPLFPADIEMAVKRAHAPVWLMTTPLHLRALVSENMALAGIAGIISATMPLDQAGAQATEQLLRCPLQEIYGCTEAGMIASRRPATDMEWQLCPDFRLRVENGQGLLEGMRVTQGLMLADSIELRASERFRLHGRIGDMIKIAGKRTTLAALNAELLSINGVSDGCFYQPEPKGGEGRLVAFVVAPNLQVHDIVSELRRRIDIIFIPRRLWKVTALPRDANGKLSRAELELLATAQVAASVSTTHLLTSASEIRGTVSPDHPALDGHFPGNPIVPGVLLLSEVIQLASRSYCTTGVKQAKFHAVLKPDQPYAIHLEQTPSGRTSGTVKFTIMHGQTSIASGLLQCEVVHETV